VSGAGGGADRFRAALRGEEARLRAAATTVATATPEPAVLCVPETPAAQRFAAALSLARDPVNTSLTGSVYVTGHSDWRLDPCQVCRHSFREGDKAWLEVADGKVRAVHDSPALSCRGGIAPPETPELGPEAARFTAALLRHYDVDRPFPVVTLRPGHPLLRGDFAARRTCKGCGHTFRPFERVARCPCNPSEPACRLYAHRDPARSQFCFDLLADPRRQHCPMDWHKLPGRGH
jgi:hypothetical protein